jgi:hypothetical protein
MNTGSTEDDHILGAKMLFLSQEEEKTDNGSNT